MLKNFKNLKGAQVLSKNEQKAVNGGDQWGGVPDYDDACGTNGILVCSEQGYTGFVQCMCVYSEGSEGGTM